MLLKKNGDLVYFYIKSFSSYELIQLKRFLKFEYAKPTPYLNIVNHIVNFTTDWSSQESFPEKLLKEKCEKEVLKNFAKYKHNLKQSIENFVSYLGISDNSEVKAYFYFYEKMYLINYHYNYKLGLYDLGYKEMEKLATKEFELGHYDFSELLFRNMNFFTSYAFSDSLDAIKENKRIRKIHLDNKDMVEYHKDIIYYLQLFFNATKIHDEELDILKEDMESFEKIVRNDSKIIITLNHLLAEVFLSTIKCDFQRDLNANLKIVDFYNKYNDSMPTSIKKNKFSAIYNASLAARRLRNEKISKEMLQEAKLFLNANPNLDSKLSKRFYYFLLAGRMEHDIFFERDAKFILKSKNDLEKAVLNNEIELTLMQKKSKNDIDILYYYIIEDFESSHDLSYEYFSIDNFSLPALLCHILSQFHLFDTEFLSYSYRNIIRHIDTKKDYREEEIVLLKKLVSLLKKAKITQENTIKEQILETLKGLNNDNYVFGNERIVEVFERNF